MSRTRSRQVYDLAAIHRAETEVLGKDSGAFAFHYPPVFLLAVSGLALMPYLVGFALWTAATAGLLLVSVRTLLRDHVVVAAAISFPGLYANLIGGQTGFLSAGILALGLTQLERRPFVAGTILGAIVYKPHFAPLVFLVLVATNRRAALAGAATSAAALSAVSLVLFGPETWMAFIENIPFATGLLYEGRLNLEEMTTVSATLTQQGLPRLPTQEVQAAVSIATAGYVVALWRGEAGARMKYAGLCFGIVLAAPFAFSYDLTIMGLGLLFFGLECQATGWRSWEAEAILIGWLSPTALIILAGMSGFIFMPLVLAALLFLTRRRSRHESNDPGMQHQAILQAA